MKTTKEIQVAIDMYMNIKGFAQKEMGNLLGTSHVTIGKWLKGKHDIKQKHFAKLYPMIKPWLKTI